MNNGAIVDGINKSKVILKKAEILFTENHSYPAEYLSPSKFSEEFFRISQEKSYDDIHRTALEKGDYDILLHDYAFFQFSKDEAGVIRYAYYQSSREIITYEDFMKQYGFNEVDFLLDPYEEKPFYRDYEQLISEAKISNSVTPVRYDYNTMQYTKITHPTSHIHIGHENQVRIPLSIILTPQAFVCFVIRHIYYNQWKIAMDNPEFVELFLSAKGACIRIDTEFFDEDEKRDLHLI
jgi:hypothetical protein